MTGLDAVRNLWDDLPENTSNALRARIYTERCKVVIETALSAEAPFPLVSGGKVSRRRLARLIGCGTAAISQNPGIRAIVASADRRLATRQGPDSAVAVQRDLDSLFCGVMAHATLPANLSRSWLVLTDQEFAFGGAAYPGTPTILFADGIHEASGDWLRHLVISDAMAVTSALQYAKTLRPYLVFCRKRRRAWESADDLWLLEWRNQLVVERNVTKQHANYSLGIIFHFYLFCEEHRLLKYRVRCYESSALPLPMRDVRFPLSATRVYAGRNKAAGWITPLLFRNVESSIGKRGTPTEEELEAAHRQALKGRNPARDTLLMRLAEDTGGRRAEILQIKARDIPSIDDVDDLAEREDAWWPLEVVRKGGRPEILRAQPDTLYAIHAYLRVRTSLVEFMIRTRPGYVEPESLFLSSTTGAPLTLDAVTALVKKFFRWTGVELVNIHRIRAKFAVDTVETILDSFLDQGVEFAPGSNWFETVLQQAAIRMGHKNPSSLRHYLTVALERRVRVSQAAAQKLKSKGDRNALLAAEAVLRKAKLCAGLLGDLDTAASPGNLADSLRKLATELEKQVETA